MAGSPANDRWLSAGKLLAALVAAGVLVAGVLLPYVGGLGLAARHEAAKFLDTTCNLTETQPPQKTTLYADDGKTVIATLFSQDRVLVPLSQVPKTLQEALIATEDRRFFSHHGVDMRGLIRSAVSTSGGATQGGSTLTMQYVKQMRYYQAGQDLAKQRAAIAQNLNRKIEDAKCALYIENVEHESKDKILENYLNIAFFGENSYGIETAASTYFNEPVQNLTVPQSAMLVGLLRAPSEYDPFVNLDAARKRRNEVLQNLVTVGKLTQTQADKYAATPISLATKSPPVVKEGCANASSSIVNAGFFCDYVVNWLLTTGGYTQTDLDTGGLKIRTTLNANVQNTAQANLFATIPADSPMTAVLPVLNTQTGDIQAMATSKRYGNPTSAKDHSHTTLPLFTSYTGFGASTYKLFPLLTALSTGVPANWPLATPANSGAYTPSNCLTASQTTNGDAQEFYSPNETLATATAKSSNTFFVGMADQLLNCDLQPIVTMAQQLGMAGLGQPGDQANQTIAQTIVNNQRAQQLVLGDVGTSPLEIAGAYATVADNGVYNAPAPVIEVKNSQNQELPVKRSQGAQVLSPQVAAQAVQILEGDTKAPGTSALPFQAWYGQNSSLIAGKTGTSVAVVNGLDTKQNAALWVVGMTPKYTAASALINFDSPNAPAAGLPTVPDPVASNAYGAYASGVWLQALLPLISGQQWTWPDPNAAAGVDVPTSILGQDLAAAQATLAAAGFKMAQLDEANKLLCASSEPSGTVAYFAPQRANPGSTITVCPSLGVPQSVYVAPPPTPVHHTTAPPAPGATTGNGGNGHGHGGGGG